MVHDKSEDPNDPLTETFQNKVVERGKRLEELRLRARTDPDVASQFEALLAEQIQAYEQFVQATNRFPTVELDSPVAIFRTAMAREIQKLRDDARHLRSKGA